MPEGPSLVIAKEIITPLLKGKKISAVGGDTTIGKEKLVGKKVTDVMSWGKHLLLIFPTCMVRIHFLLFGAYSINQKIRTSKSLRLSVTTGKTTIYFYTCALKILEGKFADHYDPEGDIMNPGWNSAKAKQKVKKLSKSMICDVLLDQDIFAGSGNIIKNEVLYRVRLHPETGIENIPPRKLTELVNQTVNYSFDFLKWKKEEELQKNWLAYSRKNCHRCNLPFIKKYTGKAKRRSYFCKNCQVKY